MGALNPSPVSQPGVSSDENEPTDLHAADSSHSGVSSDETEPTDLHAADSSHSGVSTGSQMSNAPNTHKRLSMMKLVLINPWSVCNKTTCLSDFVIDHMVDLLCVTETWLSGSDKDGLL